MAGPDEIIAGDNFVIAGTVPTKVSVTWRIGQMDIQDIDELTKEVEVKSTLKKDHINFRLRLGVSSSSDKLSLGLFFPRPPTVMVKNMKFSILGNDGMNEKILEDIKASRVFSCTYETIEEESVHSFIMLYNQGLTITCDFDYMETLPYPAPSRNCVSNQLSEGLSLLFETGELTDCTVVCGTTRIPCHKSVLCIRSPVFKAGLK